jgi:NADH-quinone oxidoreductase subunit C
MTSPSLQKITAAFSGLSFDDFRGQTRAVVPCERLFDVLKSLKEQFGFDMLVDITCVDYLAYRIEGGENQTRPQGRFGMVYLLTNTATNERITVRCFLDDPEPTAASVVSLWEGANWMEREVWDMFGIRFTGHPDLRRVLLPEVFAAHPLRKDYPLQGRGERHNFPVITRAQG